MKTIFYDHSSRYYLAPTQTVNDNATIRSYKKPLFAEMINTRSNRSIGPDLAERYFGTKGKSGTKRKGGKKTKRRNQRKSRK
jgi:hypothetical protein